MTLPATKSDYIRLWLKTNCKISWTVSKSGIIWNVSSVCLCLFFVFFCVAKVSIGTWYMCGVSVLSIAGPFSKSCFTRILRKKEKKKKIKKEKKTGKKKGWMTERHAMRISAYWIDNKFTASERCDVTLYYGRLIDWTLVFFNFYFYRPVFIAVSEVNGFHFSFHWTFKPLALLFQSDFSYFVRVCSTGLFDIQHDRSCCINFITVTCSFARALAHKLTCSNKSVRL